MPSSMKMSTWSQSRERDVNGTLCSKWGKKVYGCYLCNVNLCKDGCHIAYHNQQLKLSIIF